jgi:hypothetical protein
VLPTRRTSAFCEGVTCKGFGTTNSRPSTRLQSLAVPSSLRTLPY